MPMGHHDANDIHPDASGHMMISASPSSAGALVTVIIPARNEQDDIGGAIESVAAQDYPLERIEVVVVDGASTDATADKAKRALDGAGFRRAAVEFNPDRLTPSNLNHGLLWAEGEIVVRVDARSRIPSDYVTRMVRCLDNPAVVVAGGSQVAVAPSTSTTGRGIERALNNRHAMGLSRYRKAGSVSGPVDTVYLGSFRRCDLEAVGGWSEQFETNQDFELNRRLGRSGVVWFEADSDVEYIPRHSLTGLLLQYHRFGRWKVRYWRQTGERPQNRQLVLVFVPLLVMGATAVGLVRWGAKAAVASTMAGLVGAEAIDRRGASGRAEPRVRMVAVAANAVVAAGWLSGIIAEGMQVMGRPRQ